MTLAGLALVLAAAFCHATWNFLVKRIGGGPELVCLFSGVASLMYAPAAIYLFVTHEAAFTSTQYGFMAGTAALHLVYFVLLQEGYRRGDLSLVYPTARATGPLLSASFAVIVLHERISVQTALGGLVIVAGVLCLAGGVRRGGPRAPVSLAFGLAVGVLIGIYTVWDAHAVKVLAVPPLILDYCGNIGRAVFLSPIGYARRDIVARCWREHWKSLLVVGLLTPLSYILVLYALTFTSVVYVAPAREVSVLIAILMGSVLLKEGDLRRRLFWGAVILVGMVLLATG